MGSLAVLLATTGLPGDDRMIAGAGTSLGLPGPMTIDI